MCCWLSCALRLAIAHLKSRRDLVLENAALRHQLLVPSRNAKRPRWKAADRVFWVWLSQAWSQWRGVLRLVKPDTVIGWYRQGFRLFWRWKSRTRTAGRQSVAPATIDLIRQMSRANPLWGAPRIHGELLKLGISVAQRTVGKYMVRQPRRCGSQIARGNPSYERADSWVEPNLQSAMGRFLGSRRTTRTSPSKTQEQTPCSNSVAGLRAYRFRRSWMRAAR